MLITSFHVSNSEKVVFDFQFRLLFFFSCFHPDFSRFLRSKSFKLKSRVRNEKRFELKLLLTDSTRPLNKFLAFVMKIPISSSALTTHSPGNLISLWKATVSKQHTIRIAVFHVQQIRGNFKLETLLSTTRLSAFGSRSQCLWHSQQWNMFSEITPD